MKEKASFCRSYPFWVWMSALWKLQCVKTLIKAAELPLSVSHSLPWVCRLGRSRLKVHIAWRFRDLICCFGKFLLLSGQEETSVFCCIIIVEAEVPTGEGSEYQGWAQGIKEWNKCPDGDMAFLQYKKGNWLYLLRC